MIRISFRTARAVLATAALLLTACGGPVFQQPEITLRNVQLGGLGLTGGTLLVSLHVVNPNRFSLNANRLSYDLFLGDPEEAGDTAWLDFASGVWEQGFSVAARDTATFEIPVSFRYDGLGAAASSLLRQGTFDYRAQGTVDVRTPLGTREVPFRRGGTVSLLTTR